MSTLAASRLGCNNTTPQLTDRQTERKGKRTSNKEVKKVEMMAVAAVVLTEDIVQRGKIPQLKVTAVAAAVVQKKRKHS